MGWGFASAIRGKVLLRTGKRGGWGALSKRRRTTKRGRTVGVGAWRSNRRRESGVFRKKKALGWSPIWIWPLCIGRLSEFLAAKKEVYTWADPGPPRTHGHLFLLLSPVPPTTVTRRPLRQPARPPPSAVLLPNPSSPQQPRSTGDFQPPVFTSRGHKPGPPILYASIFFSRTAPIFSFDMSRVEDLRL